MAPIKPTEAVALCLFACQHCSDDKAQCWGCEFGTPGWPRFSDPVRKRYTVQFKPSFIADVRALGLPRYPLRSMPSEVVPNA